DLRLRRGGLLGCAGVAGDGEHMQIPVEAQPLERGAAEDLPQQPVLIGRDDVGGHALAGSDRGMGHQLHAPRRARGLQSARRASSARALYLGAPTTPASMPEGSLGAADPASGRTVRAKVTASAEVSVT